MTKDVDVLDPEVRRIIDGARRADEIRAKYRIDMKMTFFGPGSRPDDLGNVCPICLSRTPTSARHAGYVCEPCTERAVDEHGQRIAFGNADFSGGLVARVNGEKRDGNTCVIDGKACVVSEGRFGGVVYSLAGVRAAPEDPSRRGNRLAERVAGAVLGAAIGDARGPRPSDAEHVLASLLDARRAGEDLDVAVKRLGPPSAPREASVVRAYPVGLVFPANPTAREAWAVALATLSDSAPSAVARSSAMAHATASALAGDAVAHTVDVLVDSAARHDVTMADQLARAAVSARSAEAPEAVLERLRGRPLAAATYVYVRHPDDFRAALLEAANAETSTAALVGALVGARSGVNALPAEWLCDVKGRDALTALATHTLKESDYVDWDDVLAQLAAV